MDLLLSLRDGIRDLHVRIERLPVAVAISEGRVTKPQYIQVLAQLYHIHRCLEEELALHPFLATVYDSSVMARADVALQDLTYLGCGEPEVPQPETKELLLQLQHWSQRSAPALLGALYVLEGSRMGSLVLYRPLARALSVPAELGHGLDYHISGMTDRPAAWKRFITALLAQPLTRAEQQHVVDTAITTMAALHDVYAAADPMDVSPATSLGALVPTAV